MAKQKQGSTKAATAPAERPGSDQASTGLPNGKRVFVTVGTTRFDALIQALDNPAVADALAGHGYTSLLIQLGMGSYKPMRLIPPGQLGATLANGMRVEYFDFAASLAAYMASADLIISHAGSGSIFEALSLGKSLVVVPNDLLMDNHQAELAEHLAQMHYCIAATPATLRVALQDLDLASLRPYEKGDPTGIVKRIDSLMGV